MKDDNDGSYLILFSLFGIFSIFSLSYADNSINTNVGSPLLSTAFAHIFTSNDYASFVSSADQLLVESRLVQQNFGNNKIHLAQVHANNSVNILYGPMLMEIYEMNGETADQLTSDVSSLQSISSDPSQQQQVNQLVVNIDANVGGIIASVMNKQQNQGSNFIDQATGFVKDILGIEGEEQQVDSSSLQPLRFAELIDDTLLAYGRAYNVSFDMTDMTNMVMTDNNNRSILSTTNPDQDNNNNNDSMYTGHDMNTNNYSLVNIADHQSAQALGAKSLDVFNNELKPIANRNEDSLTFIPRLENGLIQLNNSIAKNASPMDIMMIVHTQIHPNLLEAFNLDLDV